jgi:hypothetical protein
MTLPQGFKTFTDGTVLTADEINGYLQQGILVFDDASERTTALTGNLREGMYSYLKSDNTTYVYDGTAWQRVGKQDVETEKNFQAFTGSGATTVPAWATKMYYVVVRGGNAGSGQTGGAGGQVLEGNTAVTGGTSLTITVGGAGANSSVAISGGSTFTANTTGAAGGSGGAFFQGGGTGGTGTLPSAPFNGFRLGGGGGGGGGPDSFPGGGGGANGGGSGGRGGTGSPASDGSAGLNAYANTGGGGGGRGANGSAATGTGGSGLVLLYFS